MTECLKICKSFLFRKKKRNKKKLTYHLNKILKKTTQIFERLLRFERRGPNPRIQVFEDHHKVQLFEYEVEHTQILQPKTKIKNNLICLSGFDSSFLENPILDILTTKTYKPQNLNVYIKIGVESDFVVEKT